MQESAPRIALIEDDEPLRSLLARAIREHGFQTSGFGSAREFRAVLEERPFDLVILDLMLPGTGGLDICRWLRERGNTPIIIVSARSSQTDRILGLELGADDYLVKPVDPQELVARMRAVLRRAGSRGEAGDQAGDGTVRFDGWRLNQRRRELYAPDGERIAVAEAEFDLLSTLVDMPQRIVSRAVLSENARGRLAGSEDRSIDVLVSRLRRKLSVVPGGRELIRTVRGVGYVFVARVRR